MSRLIRESDVQDMLDDAQCISDGEYSYVCTEDIKLSKLPTVDAVPVVRCGECKYWEEESTFCLNKDGCYGSETKTDWFCADGERKQEQ